VLKITGKTVLMELGELVDPSHTALLLVDMQRDFVAQDGVFARLGVDLTMYEPMRPRLARLLTEARRCGVLAVHVQMSMLAGGASDSPAQLRFNLRMHRSFRVSDMPLTYTEVGSPGQAFVENLEPAEGELVVPKWRSSGFWGTALDLILRSNGIRTVIVTGCTTEGCVESTARDAMFNDYYVVVPEDCVASDDRAQHEASLFLMKHRFDVVTSDALIDTWRNPYDSGRGQLVEAGMTPTSP